MKEGVGQESLEEIYLNRPWIHFYPKGVDPEIGIPDISLCQAFDNAAKKWKNRTAISFYGRKISFAELKEQVDRLASALYDLGIKKNDKVALYMLNCPQYIISCYAVLKVGAVVTPISPVYVTTEVRHQLEDSKAKAIICLDMLYTFVEKTHVKMETVILTCIDEYLPKMKKLFGKTILRNIYQKMEIPLVEIDRKKNVNWFQQLIKCAALNPLLIPIEPKEDLAALPYTGGTTGMPKGVMLTHYNLIADAVMMNYFWSLNCSGEKVLEEGKEVIAAYMPFYHIAGFVTCVIMGIISGYELIIFTTPDPDDILASIGKHGVTFFLGVPSLYEFLNNYEKSTRVNWKRLKFVFSGADALLDETAKNWERRIGIKITEGMGMTETSCASHVNPVGGEKIGSFGLPIPNTLAALIHPESEVYVPVGEVGEMVVSGPQVMKGYWNSPEATDSAFIEIEGNKWLRTGDLARMDKEGYFSFYDRKRDLIKYKGYSVFAREVEEVLKSHPKIMEAAVIGIADPNVGSNIKAFIVLESDARGRLSEEEVTQYCEKSLAHYKVPKIIEFRGEIPKTDVGKVSRRELREELEE